MKKWKELPETLTIGPEFQDGLFYLMCYKNEKATLH